MDELESAKMLLGLIDVVAESLHKGWHADINLLKLLQAWKRRFSSTSGLRSADIVAAVTKRIATTILWLRGQMLVSTFISSGV